MVHRCLTTTPPVSYSEATKPAGRLLLASRRRSRLSPRRACRRAAGLAARGSRRSAAGLAARLASRLTPRLASWLPPRRASRRAAGLAARLAPRLTARFAAGLGLEGRTGLLFGNELKEISIHLLDPLLSEFLHRGPHGELQVDNPAIGRRSWTDPAKGYQTAGRPGRKSSSLRASIT